MGRKKKIEPLDLQRIYREAYDNAVVNNVNANEIFMKLRNMVNESIINSNKNYEEITSIVTAVSKILERSSDSNKQLIKIAEILQNAENFSGNRGALSEEEINNIISGAEELDE